MLILFASATTFAQETKKDSKNEPPKSPLVTNKGDYAEVSFGQPSKRGRVIFGELVPYGQVWRTGANASTDVTFYKDVVIDGKNIRKGTYALFTIPEKDSWTVIFNSVPAQKGAFEYDKNKDKNVLEMKVPVTKPNAPAEKLNITVEKEGLVLVWDDVQIVIPVQ